MPSSTQSGGQKRPVAKKVKKSNRKGGGTFGNFARSVLNKGIETANLNCGDESVAAANPRQCFAQQQLQSSGGPKRRKRKSPVKKRKVVVVKKTRKTPAKHRKPSNSPMVILVAL